MGRTFTWKNRSSKSRSVLELVDENLCRRLLFADGELNINMLGWRDGGVFN